MFSSLGDFTRMFTEQTQSYHAFRSALSQHALFVALAKHKSLYSLLSQLAFSMFTNSNQLKWGSSSAARWLTFIARGTIQKAQELGKCLLWGC